MSEKKYRIRKIIAVNPKDIVAIPDSAIAINIFPCVSTLKFSHYEIVYLEEIEKNG